MYVNSCIFAAVNVTLNTLSTMNYTLTTDKRLTATIEGRKLYIFLDGQLKAIANGCEEIESTLQYWCNIYCTDQNEANKVTDMVYSDWIKNLHR